MLSNLMPTNDESVDGLPDDPSEFLTESDRHLLTEALAAIARQRREAEARSGDLRLG